MDIKDYFLKNSEPLFKKQYAIIKNNIIEYLSTCTDKVNITCVANWLSEYRSLTKVPGYIPPFTSVNNGTMNVLKFDDELIDTIISNIPSNVRELTLPLEIVKKYPYIFRKYPNLSKIGISGSESITFEELKYMFDNTNITDIDISKMNISDITQVPSISYYSDTNNHIKYGDKDIKSKAYRGQSIGINDFKNIDIIEQIPQDTLKQILSIKYRDNEIGIINSNNFSIILQDDVEGFTNFVNKFIEKMNPKPQEITLIAENKTYDNIEKLKELEKNAPVKIDYGESNKATIDEFANMRGTLDYFKGLILQNDLSPAEKVCYAYDLIKSHIYQEAENDLSKSRYIHSIVTEGKIVCVGYAKFLAQLLKECGIVAHTIGTKVPQNDGTNVGHERNIIEVNDDKYGIHGAYAFDCTWDSNFSYTLVNREGVAKPVSQVRETDDVIGSLDNMSNYIFFFIPASQYNLYFSGEEMHTNVSDWSGELFDPNTVAASSIRDRKKMPVSTTTYDSKKSIDEEVIMQLVYNTRLMEGYSPEINQRLLEEIALIRKEQRPKELRFEEGKTL